MISEGAGRLEEGRAVSGGRAASFRLTGLCFHGEHVGVGLHVKHFSENDHLQSWGVNPTFAKSQEYIWACVPVCFLVEIINKGWGKGYIKD